MVVNSPSHDALIDRLERIVNKLYDASRIAADGDWDDGWNSASFRAASLINSAIKDHKKNA